MLIVVDGQGLLTEMNVLLKRNYHLHTLSCLISSLLLVCGQTENLHFTKEFYTPEWITNLQQGNNNIA